MAYFDCQIVQGGGGIILTVTCNSVFAGAAITATDGVTTLSQTCPSSSPYEVQFNIPNVGTWTISGTYSGDTYTTQIIIPSSAILSPIPNGSTASPTDVIQTWLHCADIWDKNYTTISQVLADSTTLLALISSNNAVDYMARSTTWASSVCANSSAMTKIGANNYCADKLLANSTWCSAICDSSYFESVLNKKVPTMTSNTTPSGVCGGTFEQSGYEYYQAFDGNDSTYWNTYPNTTDQRVYYDFGQQVTIYKVVINPRYNNGTCFVKNFKYQSTDNTSSWNDVSSGSFSNQEQSKTLVINNPSKRRYHALFVLDSYASQLSIGVRTLQFYGRATS